MNDPSLIGTTIAKRFQITGFIGEGGMATVYRALQDREPRDVALKVMNPDLARDRKFVGRFRREAKAASMLKHPNTIRILEFGVDGEIVYLAMECVEGFDLSVALHRERRLSEARAAQIVMQVCGALTAAHSQQIVHRDLKPDNIMLMKSPSNQEVVKVLDFGIAKILDEQPDAQFGPSSRSDPISSARSMLTRVGTIVGTPAYMSPEQGRAEPVDPRSDIYSCGVLLYEMITGRPPFDGETPMQVVMKHVNEPPKPPSVYTSVHPQLEAIVMKALGKFGRLRHQNAEELQAALKEVLPYLATERRRPGDPVPAWPPPAGAPTPGAGAPATAPAEDDDDDDAPTFIAQARTDKAFPTVDIALPDDVFGAPAAAPKKPTPAPAVAQKGAFPAPRPAAGRPPDAPAAALGALAGGLGGAKAASKPRTAARGAPDRIPPTTPIPALGGGPSLANVPVTTPANAIDDDDDDDDEARTLIANPLSNDAEGGSPPSSGVAATLISNVEDALAQVTGKPTPGLPKANPDSAPITSTKPGKHDPRLASGMEGETPATTKKRGAPGPEASAAPPKGGTLPMDSEELAAKLAKATAQPSAGAAQAVSADQSGAFAASRAAQPSAPDASEKEAPLGITRASNRPPAPAADAVAPDQGGSSPDLARSGSGPDLAPVAEPQLDSASASGAHAAVLPAQLAADEPATLAPSTATASAAVWRPAKRRKPAWMKPVAVLLGVVIGMFVCAILLVIARGLES